ncbi:hypothetical protein D3C72_1777910 [compost metagenome]
MEVFESFGSPLCPIDSIAIENSMLYARLEVLTIKRRQALSSAERWHLDLEKIRLKKQIEKGIDDFIRLYTEKQLLINSLTHHK